MDDPANPARLKKRSVRIGGHDTSVSLEDAFWTELGRIAQARKMSLNRLAAFVDRGRTGNLSSALRLFVLDELRGEKKD
ncbi:MAG: ribbon-helix-helix domain-containing protein [Pseudomonadota bacterium]